MTFPDPPVSGLMCSDGTTASACTSTSRLFDVVPESLLTNVHVWAVGVLDYYSPFVFATAALLVLSALVLAGVALAGGMR